MPASRFNPASTSGIGFRLEHYVQASYLISLIVETPIPFSEGLLINELSFQAKQKADTDDLIAKLTNGARFEKHYVQSKKGFSISENPTFYEVIGNDFADFEKGPFDRKSDKLIITTDILGKADVVDGLTVLEWARFSSNSSDFYEKIKGNKKKQAKCQLFVNALQKAKGDVVDVLTVWEFLKCLHIKSYDYLDTGSKDRATLGWYLKPFVKKGLSYDHVLKLLVDYVQECNQNAATLNSTNIKEDVKELFELPQHPKLKEELLEFLKKSKSQLTHTIHNNIDGFHLDRTEYLQQLSELTVSGRFVILIGDGGLGKSALVKDFFELTFNGELGFIYFKADQLDRPSLSQALLDVGVTIHFETLISQWINLPKLIIYIDSFEKLYESDHKEAMLELLGIAKNFNSITLLASCRTYAVETLRVKYQIPKESFITIPVSPLSNEELQKIAAVKPELSKLIQNTKLRRLISIPFYLNQAVQFVDSITDDGSIDEITFKHAIWEQVIAKRGTGKVGHSTLRTKTFSQLTVKRALEKQTFTSLTTDLDVIIAEELKNEDILIKHPSLDLYAPAHDIFEDIAIVRFLMERFQFKSNSQAFIESIDTNPVFRRAVRLWIQELIFKEVEAAKLFLKEIIGQNLPIVDEILIGIIGSPDCYEILKLNKDLLLVNEAKLFNKLFRLCKIVYTIPINSEYPNVKQKAIGPGWNALLMLMDENYSTHKNQFILIMSDFLHHWSLQFESHEDIPSEGAIASKYCFQLLVLGKNSFGSNSSKLVLETLFRMAPADKENVYKFLREAVEFHKTSSDRRESRMRSYDKLFQMLLEETYRCVRIYELFPDLIIELAKIEWLNDESPEIHSSDHRDKSFGLSGYPYDYFSPSSNQTPFKYLLEFHPEKAIAFLMEIANRGVLVCINVEDRNKKSIQKIKVDLGNGSVIEQYGSAELWSAYRGFGYYPYLIQSALMALEEYLLNEAAKGENLSLLFDLIMEGSNSVLLTGILASIAVEHPLVFGDKIYSLFKVREFFKWDLSRYTQEFVSSHTTIGNDPYYTHERFNSNQLKHRKLHLENLVSRLQLFNPVTVNEILDNHKDNADRKDELWRLAIARMDMRNTEAEVDKEKSLLILKPKPLPQDLQKVVDQGETDRRTDESAISIFLWCQKILKKEDTTTIDEWKAKFEQLKSFDEDNNLSFTNPTKLIAVIGIRDFVDLITEAELELCAKELLKDIDESVQKLKLGYFHDVTFSFDNIVFEVYPLLLREELGPFIDPIRIKDLIIDFLILLPDHQKNHLIKGVKDYMWGIDAAFADECFQTLLKLSHDTTINNLYRNTRYQSPDQFKEHIDSTFDSFKQANPILVKEINLPTCDGKSLIEAMDAIPYQLLDGRYKPYLDEILDQTAILTSLEEYKHYKFKVGLEKLIAYYVSEISSPSSRSILHKVLRTMESHFKFTMEILKWMTAIGHDRNYPEQLAANLKTVLDFVLEQDPRIGLVYFLLFESLQHPDNAYKLPNEGEIRDIHEKIISQFGGDSNLTAAIFKLLSGIGSVYQPICLTWLMHSLAINPQHKLTRSNGLAYIEKFVQQMCDHHLDHLQKNRDQIDYFIRLLNVLVENGSTIAFRLRDEII